METFLAMISKSKDLDRKQIPVFAYLDHNVNGVSTIAISNMKRGSITLPGDVAPEDQARIVNWLENRMQSVLSKPPMQCTALERDLQSSLSSTALDPMTEAQARHAQSSTIQLEIIGTAVLAHAITLFISGTRRILPLEKAFEVQLRQKPKFGAVDVDRECLSVLEQRLFNSGEEDWGTDSGAHQDDWDPYDGIRDSNKRQRRIAKVRNMHNHPK